MVDFSFTIDDAFIEEPREIDGDFLLFRRKLIRRLFFLGSAFPLKFSSLRIKLVLI